MPHKCLNPCEVQYFLGKKNYTNVVATPKKKWIFQSSLRLQFIFSKKVGMK
jgi:5-deoxy-D-glucuronate isomerase